MTPSRDPDADPQQDAAAPAGAPETDPISERDQELAALFGATVNEPEPRSHAEDAARHEQLAALFGGRVEESAQTPKAQAGEAAGSEQLAALITQPAQSPESRDVTSASALAAPVVAGAVGVTGAADAVGGAAGASVPGGAVPGVAAGETSESVAAPSTVAGAATARGIRRSRRSQASPAETAAAEQGAAGADEVAAAAQPLPQDATPSWISDAAGAPPDERADRDNPQSADSDLDSDDIDAAAIAALFAPLAAGAHDDPQTSPFAFDPDAAPDAATATHDEPTVATETGADLGAASAMHDESTTASVTDAETDATSAMPDDTTLEPPVTEADTLAWLAATAEAASDSPSDEPQKAAPTDWLDIVGGTAATTALAPAAAAADGLPATAAADGPSATATAPVGEFAPAPRRGIRGWSKRMRWSVAISIVLLAGLVVGSVYIAQTVAANSREAQELAAAVAELEAAEAAAAEPEFALSEAVRIYDDTVELAATTAESAGPPLAAVTGMVDEPLRAASEAALADLVAELAVEPPPAPPEPYERGDIDLGDVAAIEAATAVAEAHADEVTTATETVRLAQLALQEKLDALRAAQVALGTSLPATAEAIAGENPRAEQNFRDAVVAAAAAVGAVQAVGESGDAELLAYADAVTALRADQLRAETVTQPVRPVNPAPVPTTDPAPQPTTPPAPQPTPEPTPVPTEPPPPVDPLP